MVISLPIPAGYEAIERPMVFQLTHQLMEERLLPRVERIIFKDQVDQTALKNSESDSCPTSVHYEKDSYIEITVSKTQRETPNALQTNFDDYPKILLDRAHGLSMTTIYNSAVLDLEFTIVMPSIAALRNYKSTVRQILSSGREIGLHDFMYKYSLPPQSWQWLNDMYELMDTELSLVEWVKTVSVNNLQLITSGTHLEAAIADKQLEVIGSVTDRPTSIEKNNSSGVYRMTFGYQLRFNQPDNILFSYPLMIEQTMVDNKYLPKPPGINPYFFWDSSMDALQLPMVERNTPVRVPEIDVQVITRQPNGYHSLLTILVTIDDEDELECFNLLELGDVMIDRRLAKLWKDTGTITDLTTLYKAPFLLTLHKGQTVMDQSYLEIDDQFNVRFTEPMDRRGIYRISLCLLDLPYRLPRPTLKLLERNPNYYLIYCWLILWSINQNGSLSNYQLNSVYEFCGNHTLTSLTETLDSNDVIHDDDLPTTTVNTRPPYVYVSNAYNRQPKTVQTSWVTAK